MRNGDAVPDEKQITYLATESAWLAKNFAEVTFGQASGPIGPIAPVLRSQKGSLFLTRPVLFHYIERRDALEASANELFEVVASGKVNINVNHRFALKEAADTHKALQACATCGSTILTI